MSRTILWIVTVFLALAMVAMIVVQAYWINRSRESEEMQLSMVVNQVLSELSDELVQNETIISILDEIRPPLVQQRSQAVWNFHIDDRSAYNGSEEENVLVEEGELDLDQDLRPEKDPDQDLRPEKDLDQDYDLEAEREPLHGSLQETRHDDQAAGSFQQRLQKTGELYPRPRRLTLA